MTAATHQTSLRATPKMLNVARAALKGHNIKMAMTIANKVLAGAPDSAAAMVVKSDVLFDQGNQVAARMWAEKALAAAPSGTAAAHMALGRALDHMAPKKALGQFRAAIAVNPELVSAYVDQGVALSQLGRIDQSVASFDQARRIDPRSVKARVDLSLALALRQAPGDLPKAESILAPMVQSGNAPASVQAAFTYVSTRNAASTQPVVPSQG
jgi:tetratricopeptide (TPR) repeat protein